MVTTFSSRLATCFGIGYIPWAAGTFASLAALPLGWVLVIFKWPLVTVAAIVVTFIAIWACGAHARKTGVSDPSECVLDEVAGQWIALIPIAIEARASDWRPFVMAFFLFRLFDIWKPWPASAAEKLPGGFGIVLDDVVAGLIAAVILYAFLFIQLV
jgi:phosphatidylglycerophosphatase A